MTQMKLLFVHEHLGALGGAEANIHLTARELKQRGHAVGLLHGSATGASETTWRETFAQCFRLREVNRHYDATRQIDGLEQLFQQVMTETTGAQVPEFQSNHRLNL